jgi:hypothetical protein
MTSAALASEGIVHKIRAPRNEISGAGKGAVVVLIAFLLEQKGSSAAWKHVVIGRYEALISMMVYQRLQIVRRIWLRNISSLSG